MTISQCGLFGLLLLGASLPAQEERNVAGRGAASGRAFARELLGELVALDTTPAHGCTQAAEAMAVRFRAAGFPDSALMCPS